MHVDCMCDHFHGTDQSANWTCTRQLAESRVLVERVGEIVSLGYASDEGRTSRDCVYETGK